MQERQQYIRAKVASPIHLQEPTYDSSLMASTEFRQMQESVGPVTLCLLLPVSSEVLLLHYKLSYKCAATAAVSRMCQACGVLSRVVEYAEEAVSCRSGPCIIGVGSKQASAINPGCRFFCTILGTYVISCSVQVQQTSDLKALPILSVILMFTVKTYVSRLAAYNITNCPCILDEDDGYL